MRVLQLQRRLMLLAYGVSLIAILAYTLWLYAMGHYHALLMPMMVTLLLVTALLMHYGPGLKTAIPHIILLTSTYSVVLASIYFQPATATIWLGLPIVATFLLLPLWAALCLNLICIPLWWWLPLHGETSLVFALSYLALMLLSALPPWEHARQRALLKATDPNDEHCDAYHIEAFKEQLNNEFQRAEMLHKRLAVLLLHLPQLEMAEEQFGQRAKIALLQALCNEVNSRCRDHDSLGRAGNATFMLVLPNTSESGALLVRERLQRALSHQVLVETGPLEASISVCLPSHEEGFEHYLQRLEARAHTLSNA